MTVRKAYNARSAHTENVYLVRYVVVCTIALLLALQWAKIWYVGKKPMKRSCSKTTVILPTDQTLKKLKENYVP